MKKLLTMALGLALCLTLSVPAFAAGTCTEEHFQFYGMGHCNANGVNVRTGPGTNYHSNGYAYKGDRYGFYETMSELNGTKNQDFLWDHVHGNHIGWMYRTYFTLDEVARVSPRLLERA